MKKKIIHRPYTDRPLPECGLSPHFFNRLAWARELDDEKLTRFLIVYQEAYHARNPPIEIRTAYAILLMKHRLYEQAEAVLEDVIARVPGHVRGHGQLGNCCCVLLDYDKAHRHFWIAVALAPRDPVGWARLSNWHYDVDQRDVSIDMLRRAVEVAPGNRSMRNTLQRLVEGREWE